MTTKRRRSWAEIGPILNAYRKSGLSQGAFEKRQGLATNSISRWLRKEAKVRAPDRDLLEVKVKAAGPTASQVELVLKNGRVIRVPLDFDPAGLLRLVEALEALEARC